MATKKVQVQPAKNSKIIVSTNESKQQKEKKDAMDVVQKEDTLELKPHDHLNVGLVSYKTRTPHAYY